MPNHEWVNEFDTSIVVCDKEGMIIEMNQKACATFTKYGGAKLIGSSLYACHAESSQAKLKELLAHEKSNIYTILKNQIKKIVIQKPWYQDGKFSGLVEITCEIPLEMKHFVRE